MAGVFSSACIGNRGMSLSRAYIPLFIFCNLIMIPLKNELVKCNCICALSALSFLHGKIIICNFFQILGENSLRIYSYPHKWKSCRSPVLSAREKEGNHLPLFFRALHTAGNRGTVRTLPEYGVASHTQCLANAA